VGEGEEQDEVSRGSQNNKTNKKRTVIFVMAAVISDVE
jgi:hypothetical protein